MNKTIKFPKDFKKTFIDVYGASINPSSSEAKKVSESVTTIFTDFYLLSRMFAEFGTDETKIKRSPKGCPITGDNNFKTPKYIIVYAGDLHIIKVKRFLKKMFGKESLKYTTTHRLVTPDMTYDGTIMSKKINVISDITPLNTLPRLQNIDDLINTFLK